MSDIKLSNVIGAPFSPFVLEQLQQRASQNSTATRTNEQVLFLANKMSWARLVSSVNVVLPPIAATPGIFQVGANVAYPAFYESLGLDYTDYPQPDSLAKNWILEAGTSIQSGNGVTLRKGIGVNGAYGLGGTEELGYTPMPGLNSVQVQTMGSLGSLRQATISFKVWNMNQLNVIEALYFRLGYSMLLEWGHVQYFQNNGAFIQDGIYGINNPFSDNRRKEDIQQEIAKKVKETDGNYDGMLAIVSNFNWSFNQSGGYDCTLKLIGLGAIMDSLRIDQTYALPPGSIARFKKDQDALEAEAQRRRNQNVVDQTQQQPQQEVQVKPRPRNITEAYERVKEYANFQGTRDEYITQYGVRQFLTNPERFNNNNSAFININYNPSFTGRSQAEQEKASETYNGLWIFYTNRAVLVNPKVDSPVNVKIDLTQVNELARLFYRQNPASARSSYGETFVHNTALVNYVQLGTDSFLVGGGTRFEQVSLDSILRGRDGLSNVANDLLQLSIDSSLKADDLYFRFDKIEVLAPNRDNPVSRKLILDTLYARLVDTKVISASITSVDYTAPYATIKGLFTLEIETPGINNASAAKKLVNFYFTTTNPAIIEGSDIQETITPPTTVTQTGNDGNTTGNANGADIETTESPKGFQSALQAMLTIVKARVQATSNFELSVSVVDITEITQEFYDSGILKDIFITTTATNNKKLITPRKPPVAGPNGLPFDITNYALKGFNTELMTNPTLYDQVSGVEFDKLCKALIVRYPNTGADEALTNLLVPVYISFGYLLAFLNNMCLIYDSEKPQTGREPASGKKHPYVYIDFNPNTNFCLTSPQQFSIDPKVCLVPMQANLEQYQTIFPDSVLEKNTRGEVIGIKGNQAQPLFDSTTGNSVSTEIIKFAPFQNTDLSPYQGKIMNILLEVDYLLGLAKSFQGSDPEHAVRLQPFLEQIVTDINKSLGNMNLFKVKYRDDTNTIQIQDSQWTPSLDKEDSIMVQETSSLPRGMLPIFGKQSLAREFQFKTVISTKLASTIAISAQAATGSINATDHSSYSWLNQNFQDRYKRYIQDPDSKASGASNDGRQTNNEVSNEVKAAAMFNQHVKNVYDNPSNYSNENAELAKNYYIEAISKTKSEDQTTVSAPFIPADLEITIDGVSGIIMGNAFLIPEDRMPRSLRGVGGIPKVGFIVTSLMHTIEKNQWLTKMRGQMIKLRGYRGFGTVATVGGAARRITSSTLPPGAANDYSGATQVASPDSINTRNFNEYYPGYTFTRGQSDINLSSYGLQPLTENEIIDSTTENRFKLGTLTSPVQYFVIHHTGGTGTAQNVFEVFYSRGLPAQYVIDRNGRIYRFMPDGAKAYHAGPGWNSRSIGVEIIALNDRDVTTAQRNAAIRLAQFLGFKVANIVGHGKISSEKQDTEGFTVVNFINPNYRPGFDPTYG